jgi:hypothetical protein
VEQRIRWSVSRAIVGLIVGCVAACGAADPEAAATSVELPPAKETTGAELGGLGASSSGGSNTQSAPAFVVHGPNGPGGGSPSEDGGAASDGGGASKPNPPIIIKPLYVPPECGADCLAHDIPEIIVKASKKYNIPRWFYYAIIRRESSFNRCKTQPESTPSADWGRGLTQVTFPWYAGVPYPQHLPSIDNTNATWRNNMGLGGSFGPWINMADVTPIPSPPATEQDCKTKPKTNDAYDPTTNIDRFSSGFAAPAWHLYRVAGEAAEETWRKVAYHWHYGLWGSKSGKYPIDPRPYLTCTYCYDTYVKQYKPPVEADDGVYKGAACKPPYSASGC